MSLRHEVLRALPPEQRLGVLVAGLRQEVSRLARIAPARIGAEEPLSHVGLDSLAAVELQHLVESGLGVTLEPGELLDGVRLIALARKILERWDQESEPSEARTTESPEAGPSSPALSYGQRALWFLHRLAPDSRAYHITAAARIWPALDGAAFARALRALAERHEALRSTFREHEGEPVVEIGSDAMPELVEWEASRWSADELRERLEEEAFRPFDPAVGPLLRVALFRRRREPDVVLLAVHHLVADFWSLTVLSRELGILYQQETGAGTARPAPPSTAYSEYVRWQRSRIESAEGEALWAYWRDRLAGAPAEISLPTDRPRPPIQTYEGDRLAARLDPELSDGLAALAQRHGNTLFVTLLAGFQTLLMHYSGQDDLPVGSPTAGRERAGHRGLVGYCVNPVVLRGELHGRPSFVELLGRTRRCVVDALRHQGYPFPLLAERLQPERDPSRSPIFQVVFLLQEVPFGQEPGLAAVALGEPGVRLPLGELTLESMALAERASPFELTMRMAKVEGRLVASLSYNRDLFDATTMHRSVRHFRELLRSAVAEPGRPVSAMELLPDAERAQLRLEWNDTRGRTERAPSIHARFESRARRFPQRVAVSLAFPDGGGPGVTLTYAELNARANRLARHLRRLGVGPEVAVGLFLDRSPEMIVATLAVLKAGGVYMPLDTAYPEHRLAFMVGNARAPVLVTVDRLADRLASSSARRVLLDTGAGEIAGESGEDLGWDAASEYLAYLMYTSGSTGRPKGVAVAHRSVLRLVGGSSFASFGPRQVFLQMAAVSFDASTLEIWGALLHGARLEIAADRNPSLERLGALVEATRVTTLWLTAGLFHQMVDHRLESLAGVRELLAGGDVLSPAHVEQVLAKLPGTRMINGYGPTENTTFTCCHPMIPGAAAVGTVPIGRPIDETTVHVVGHDLRPCPIGVTGELLTGGLGLARGYFARPALTAGRFVPDPISGERGERLYRTGDRARLLPDGSADFLGRLDRQLKLRGFRIELAEIEAALGDHPGVGEVVVLAREDLPGGRGLVAFWMAGEGAPSAAQLREFLDSRLPEYMVPPFYVEVDRFPLTANGKVDRAALGRQPLPSAAGAGESPRTPAEEILAGIFARLFDVAELGAGDSFFDLGGHSLLATRLVAEIRSSFEVELPLAAVFEAPTVRQLASRIEAARRAGESALPAIAPSLRGGPAPASFAQQRLWFLQQLEAASAAYNVPAALRLLGPLEVAALAAALGEIVRRHEALRTTFEARSGSTPDSLPSSAAVVQKVATAARIRLPVVDLGGLEPRRLVFENLRRLEREARRPFRLDRGPLVRMVLFRRSDREHVLLLNLHHVVSDGWSLGVLFGELKALYEAAAARRPSPLPELALQYADFARWQRRYLSGPVLERELSYWRNRLAGAPPVLELPADRPRPPSGTFSGANYGFTAGRVAPDDLKALARGRVSTLFMALLSAFQALIGRYTGQADFAVGTPVAGRHHAGTEELIGFFVNTLALRADLSGAPTFTDLMERVRRTTLEAHAHQDLPFERLVEELQPQRELNRTPLVQVMFVLHEAGMARLELTDVEAERLEVSAGATKFDLTLTLEEAGDALRGTVEYPPELFDATTVARLRGHYENVLAAVVADPTVGLSRLPLMSRAESHQLVTAWGRARSEFSAARALYRTFERQAARRADSPALAFEGRTLTYAELNARANRLARRLRRLGAGERAGGTLVGLLLDRSVELVVSILAVHKAGGAYVPLDPSYPTDRLVFLLRDALGESASPVLVTERRHLSLLEKVAAGARRLSVDAEWPEIAGESGENLEVEAAPEDLAYVIYTSGSTGRPKGVEICHASLSRLFSATRRWFDFGADDVWTLFHSFAFDFSVWELWGALAHGGRLVVVPYWVSRSPGDFHELLRREGVTVLNQTPSAFRELIRADAAAPPSARAELAVQAVIFGGEALELKSLEPWIERRGAARPRLVNMYGITETTVHVTYRPLGPADLEEAHRSPLGVAIPDLSLHVLDAAGEPAAVGIPGELRVGGAGLARGYLGRARLTAQRFLPDPYSGVAGTRLYRTGDLVRWRPGAEVDYLGRIDHQVKIRGFRIELGEIETALTELPGIRQAVVLARETGEGNRILVAHVAAEPSAAPAVGRIRDALRSKLPGYMVPGHVLVSPALPLTGHGKVDRNALERLPLADPAPGTEAAEPPTPTEEILAGIFAEVLGLKRVGPGDDFFELGGHSLLATQVTARIREAFGVELAVRSVFERPTTADLSRLVDGAALGAPPALPTILPAPRQAPPPLSFAQRRLWFLTELDPGNAAYNIPVAVRLRGPLVAPALAGSLAEIVRRHEALRTTFVEVGGEPRQVIADAAAAAWRIAAVDLRRVPDGDRAAELRRSMREEAARPFDLGRGPLLRGTVYRLGRFEHALLLVMHHITSDGWSMGVLVRELRALYEATVTGRPSPLSELEVQYADYAAWQRGRFSPRPPPAEDPAAATLPDSELSYWKKQLAGLAPVLELPTDRPRPSVMTSAGDLCSYRLDPELTARLESLSRRHATTLFMTLLAAFQVLLGRYTGRTDFAVGTPIAGRRHRAVEPLIGFFVNTLVLRADLSGAPAFTRLMLRVRETTLAAYAHQELPFEMLVEELRPERSLSHTPLFQVMLALQNAPLEPLELEALTLEPLEVASGTARFDLTLLLAASGGGLRGGFEYNRGLFDPSTAVRLAGHFTTLLESIAAEPGRRIAELDLLPPAERAQVVAEWNDTMPVGRRRPAKWRRLWTRTRRCSKPWCWPGRSRSKARP